MEEYFEGGRTFSTILELEKELQTLKLEKFMTSTFNEAIEEHFPLLELKNENLKNQRVLLTSEKDSQEELLENLTSLKEVLYTTLLKKQFEIENLKKMMEIEKQEAENKMKQKIQEKKRKMINHIKKLQSTEMVKKSIQAKEDAAAEEANLQIEKTKLKKLIDKHNHLQKIANAEDCKNVVKLAKVIQEQGALNQKWEALQERKNNALEEVEKIKEAKTQLKNNQESDYYQQIKKEFTDKMKDNQNMKDSFKDPNDFPQLTLRLQIIKSSVNKDNLKKLCFSESRKKRVHDNYQATPKSSKKQKKHHRTPRTEGYKKAQEVFRTPSVMAGKGLSFLAQCENSTTKQKKPQVPETSKKVETTPIAGKVQTIAEVHSPGIPSTSKIVHSQKVDLKDFMSQKLKKVAAELKTAGAGGSGNFSFIHLKQQQLAGMSTPKTSSTKSRSSKRKMSKTPEVNSMGEPAKKMKENKNDEILTQKQPAVTEPTESRSAEKKNVLMEIKPKPNIVEMILTNPNPTKELKTPVAKSSQEKKKKSMSSGRKKSKSLLKEESQIASVKKTPDKRRSAPAEVGDVALIKTPKNVVTNKPSGSGTEHDKENVVAKTPVFSSSEDVDSEKLRHLVEEASTSKKPAGKDNKGIAEENKMEADDDPLKPKIISDVLIEPAVSTSIDNISSDFEGEINFDSKSVDYDQLFNMDTGNFDSSSLNFSDEFKTDGAEFNFSPKSNKSGTSNNVDFGATDDKAAADMDIEHLSLF